jgi:hypothetical protein
MKSHFFLSVVFLLLITSITVDAQRKPLIEGEFNAAPFEEFIRKIEEQTSYKFYFNPAWTDSIKVTLSAKNRIVEEVLRQAFENRDLKFIVTSDNNIFITKGRDIMPGLPADFFRQSTGDAPREGIAFDFSEYEKRERSKRQAEEKLYSIGPRTSNMAGTATMIGTVRDRDTGEPIVGGSVYIEKPLIGTATDQNGHFSITLPKGKHQLLIKSVGMKDTYRQIMLYGNGRLDIDMDEEITPLKEVIVESERDVRVTGMQMGMEKLDIRTMKQMPLALGETDIMKVVLALPGVQSVGEGTVGLNVRGGATNQNLILLNDAVVYNPSHLFGFFSTFNPDVLKSVELYKSGIGAEYGGRLSSVMDVHTREGNLKKFSGSGGISPVTGRLTIEGPIIKETTSFILGLRSTYSNWILKQLSDDALKNSTASFYDITANVAHKINDNNNLYVSFYTSKDRFRLNGDTTYRYSDQNASLKWKHVFNNKLHGTLTGAYSNYGYEISSEENPAEAFRTEFAIRQLNGKADVHYFPNAKHTITGGLHATHYQIAPGDKEPLGEESLQVGRTFQEERGIETALYVGDEYAVTPSLSVYGGLRFSFFQYLGARDVFQYGSGAAKDVRNITDTLHYEKGERITSYNGLEPRVSLRYTLSNSASVKLSYNRMRQYIQMLSNTTAITPTDIWKLSDNYIKPQVGDQYSIGFYKNVKGNSIETSVEAYYKDIATTNDFKNGAELLSNGDHLETEVIDARGKAYGIEVMVKKGAGKLNGWISYTYSRSFLKTTGAYGSESVNNNEFYASNYDKPHAVNFISNYKFSRRFNFSWNVVYSSGRPITIPVAKYTVEGAERVLYGPRNGHRIPDYFRMDISINIEGNHKVRKLAHSSWTLAVYNLTGRENAYSVYFVTEAGEIKGYKLSIFARPIPTITYNFKF